VVSAAMMKPWTALQSHVLCLAERGATTTRDWGLWHSARCLIKRGLIVSIIEDRELVRFTRRGRLLLSNRARPEEVVTIDGGSFRHFRVRVIRAARLLHI
jgi:hypothetical protein